jgi:hypothetical protein
MKTFTVGVPLVVWAAVTNIKANSVDEAKETACALAELTSFVGNEGKLIGTTNKVVTLETGYVSECHEIQVIEEEE